MLGQPLLLALMLLVVSGATPAEDSQAVLAEQDARERQAAVAFAESRGLDFENAAESDTGLLRFVLTEGEGPPVTSGDTVVAHCTGWLSDGTKF